MKSGSSDAHAGRAPRQRAVRAGGRLETAHGGKRYKPPLSERPHRSVRVSRWLLPPPTYSADNRPVKGFSARNRPPRIRAGLSEQGIVPRMKGARTRSLSRRLERAESARRRTLIADTWTEEGYYVDSHRRGDGHNGIDAMIRTVQERFPTYRFRLSSVVDAHNDRVRFTWKAGGTEDAPMQFVGTDFGVVAKDGRFESITGFVDVGTGRAVEAVTDMRCARLSSRRVGRHRTLTDREHDVPTPGPHGLLVRVRVASLIFVLSRRPAAGCRATLRPRVRPRRPRI